MEKLDPGVGWNDAIPVLKRYNTEPFHLRHSLTVGQVMDWYALELGYGEDREFWAVAGLMHDVDFEQWPEEHCVRAPRLLEEAGFSAPLIHAVCSHGWGLTGTDARPEHEMEKVLFAADELTGIIGAAALMRPSRSVRDMELKSLKKKFKDRKFAAGCSRDVILQGAELLGWEPDELLTRTLAAMAAREDAINALAEANL